MYTLKLSIEEIHAIEMALIFARISYEKNLTVFEKDIKDVEKLLEKTKKAAEKEAEKRNTT